MDRGAGNFVVAVEVCSSRVEDYLQNCCFFPGFQLATFSNVNCNMRKWLVGNTKLGLRVSILGVRFFFLTILGFGV